MESTKPIHICIAGPIGSGKTKLVKALQDILKHSNIVPEPIDLEVLSFFLKSADADEENSTALTKRNYSDSAFSFQMSMLTNRFAKLIVALNDPEVKYVISDQGLLFDTVYASMHRDKFSEEEYNTYCKLYKQMNKRVSALCETTIIVYLNESIDTCLKRVKKRDRPGEIHTYIVKKPDYIPNLKTKMDTLVSQLEEEGDYVINKITVPPAISEKHYIETIGTMTVKFMKATSSEED